MKNWFLIIIYCLRWRVIKEDHIFQQNQSNSLCLSQRLTASVGVKARVAFSPCHLLSYSSILHFWPNRWKNKRKLIFHDFGHFLFFPIIKKWLKIHQGVNLPLLYYFIKCGFFEIGNSFFQVPKGLLFTTAEQQKISSTKKVSLTEKLTTTAKITTASQITTTKISTTLATTSTHRTEFSKEKITKENITRTIDIKNSTTTSSAFSFDIPGYVYRIGSKIVVIVIWKEWLSDFQPLRYSRTFKKKIKKVFIF